MKINIVKLIIVIFLAFSGMYVYKTKQINFIQITQDLNTVVYAENDDEDEEDEEDEKDEDDDDNDDDDKQTSSNSTKEIVTYETVEVPATQAVSAPVTVQVPVIEVGYNIDTDGDQLVDAIDPNPTIPQKDFFTDSDNDGIANAFDEYKGENDFAYSEFSDSNENGLLDQYEGL